MQLQDKKYLYETYVIPKIKNSNGSKTIMEEDLKEVSWDPDLIKYVRDKLKMDGIKVYEIDESTRSPLVRDNNHGDVESLEVESLDKPKLSNIEYVEEQVVSEDYKELDDLIFSTIIPEYSHIASGELSIPLFKLTALKLSDKEMKHVFKVLDEEGIVVRGTSQNFEEEDNYEYITTYHHANLPKALTGKEATDLVIKYQNETDLDKKRKLRNQIADGTYRLIRLIASRYHYFDSEVKMEFDDLMQAGYIALLSAIENFDPTPGYKFTSYAYKCIQGGMLREYGRQSIFPEYMYEELRAMEYAIQEFKKEFNREPTNEELAYTTNKPTERVYMLRKLIHQFRSGQHQLKVLVDASTDIEEAAMASYLKEEIIDVLETLTEREQRVLMLRYGLLDGRSRSLEEVGIEFHLGKERIRQIEAKALRKLRHPARSRRLKAYADVSTSPSEYVYYGETDDFIPDETDYTGRFTREDYDYNGNTEEEDYDPITRDYEEFGFVAPKQR